MKLKKLSGKIIILTLIGLGFLPLACAEMITLKSGLKFTAEILERKDDYIIINWQGQGVRYSMSEIESIAATPAAQKGEKEEEEEVLGTADDTGKKDISETVVGDPQQIVEYLNKVGMNINSLNKKTSSKQPLLSQASAAGDTEKIFAITTEMRNILTQYKQKFLALAVPKGCEELSELTLQWYQIQADIFNEIIKGNIEQANLLTGKQVESFNKIQEEAGRLAQYFSKQY